MTKSVKGTKTEQNLMIAFASESMAVNRYTYFAEAASQEGYQQITVIFMETAEDERAHARVFSTLFESGVVEINASFPSVVVSKTKDNLEVAIAGEKATWNQRYSDFFRIAAEEGLPDIAHTFESIGRVEKFHEERFRRLIALL
ncbi:MAG: rubrerythrin family protein [Deltaproteobacteria bacterium]|nr:rubrerythrin family protein [Deltaproteobacteria bacterium]